MDTADEPSFVIDSYMSKTYEPPSVKIKVPQLFPLLLGEGVVHYGKSSDGHMILTNYRLYLQLCGSQHHIPLGLIEVVEHRDLFYLQIGCKDARTYRCTFENNEKCLEWFSQLLKASAPPRDLQDMFAFYYFHCSAKEGGEETLKKIEMQRAYVYDEQTFKSEVERLKFNIHGVWRISSANKNYKLCGSYPPQLLVPSCTTDETLESVAKFRSSRRIPAIVWRHVGNGAVIARCSQPEVGWLGWRSAEDEDLLKAISDACNYDRGPKTMLETNQVHSPTSNHSDDAVQTHTTINLLEKKKVLIMDARSYTTAVANRARGGGCECPEYYPCCEIQFMNLANIHSIRKSFHALRQLYTSTADQLNWFSQLEATRWFHHMSGLMRAAVTLVTAVERDARPVLVHCSDGWDRTPQIVALAELLLDPFYRTVDGFRILVEREWLAFGHKFADRCGHATGSEDQNERCPVFLQWLDCVHQLVVQFPCSFEFSHTFLVKLVHHTYSNLFGTFLCNTKQERMEKVNGNTFSIWCFLNARCFKNHLYAPPGISASPVLWPKCNVRDLHLWSEVYSGSLEVQTACDTSSEACPGPPDTSPSHMPKTRSYGDLKNALEAYPSQLRRCSDPSITLDIKPSSLQLPADGELYQTHVDDDPKENGVNERAPELNDFFTNEFIDDVDCNSDCIYKKTDAGEETATILLDDTQKCNGNAVQNGETVNDDDANVIFGNKTDLTNGKDFDCDLPLNLMTVNEFESICLGKKSSDINHNGEVRLEYEDNSETECGDLCDSGKSENGTCNGVPVKDGMERSVETSTETLVSENMICGSSPKEICGFEKLSAPDMYSAEADMYNVKQSGNTSSKNFSSSPGFSSHASSDNDFDRNGFCPYLLDSDGLIHLKSHVQERLEELDQTHKRKEEALKRELHMYRQALIKQVCHTCSHSELERQDDSSDCDESVERSVKSKSQSLSPQRLSSPEQTLSSVVDSVCSAGEGQASAVESLRSDTSWEAVEAHPAGDVTLWVPDHAATHCMGCRSAFWAGKRRHHCRSCGKVFCGDCSDNSTPIPEQHLYDPVRVCTTCYSRLRRDANDLSDRCKHASPQPTNNNPQITASSN